MPQELENTNPAAITEPQHPLLPVNFEQAILTICGTRVVIDADLADFYGIETKVFNQAVKRHAHKFPADFMFELSREEKDKVVTTCNHLERLKYSPNLPKAFTEHGLLMAANVLRSERADLVSVALVRAFVRLRELSLSRDAVAGQIALQDRAIVPGKKPKAALEKRLDAFLDKVVPQIEKAVETVLDTVVNTQAGTTVREEAKSLLSDSIEHLHAKLKKAGLGNEEIAARIMKMIAETETERARFEKTRHEARITRAEADHREMIETVRKLRVVLAAHRFLTGEDETDLLTQRLHALVRTLEEIARE